MIRIETKGRARALQLLYAWELTGAPVVAEAATGLARLTGPEPRILDRAEALVTGVVASLDAIDRAAAVAADNWRLSRIATVERNILRLAIYELQRADPAAPPKVIIDEAVQLAHWFGGARAPAFVNGVLDRVARELGVL
ncbi:MAG: transcription antitermination factor NusB [Gemmatimonadales bacterium]|jgi:N utilization substance protein B